MGAVGLLSADTQRLKRFPIITFFICTTFLISSVSCRQANRKRPYGDYSLGKVTDLMSPETDMPQFKLLLRHDNRGFYVMSTMCTHDLTYLERKNIEGKYILASTYTESKYDLNGKVLSGPAVVDLPYYNLKIAAGEYGGAKDTLFAEVGKEVPKDWRLALQ